jgi:hypothetical protein
MLAPRALALIPGLPATDVEGIDPPSPTRLWVLGYLQPDRFLGGAMKRVSGRFGGESAHGGPAGRSVEAP